MIKPTHYIIWSLFAQYSCFSVPVVFEESTWSEVITTHFIVVLVVLVVTGQLIWLARYYNRTAKPFVLPDVVHYTGVSTSAYFKPPTDPIPLIFWSPTAAILSVCLYIEFGPNLLINVTSWYFLMLRVFFSIINIFIFS